MQKHLACQTQYSRTGTVSLKNNKPYRTAAQKEMARKTARRCEDGAWRSTAPVSYHSK